MLICFEQLIYWFIFLIIIFLKKVLKKVDIFKTSMYYIVVAVEQQYYK